MGLIHKVIISVYGSDRNTHILHPPQAFYSQLKRSENVNPTHPHTAHTDSSTSPQVNLTTGLRSTAAGNFSFFLSDHWEPVGDNGPAISACVGQPFGIAFDATGNLFFADAINNIVRKVSE